MKINEFIFESEESLEYSNPTSNIRDAMNRAQRYGGKVVRSTGGAFIAVKKSDSRPEITIDLSFYSGLEKLFKEKEQLEQQLKNERAQQAAQRTGNYPLGDSKLAMKIRNLISAKNKEIKIYKETVPNYKAVIQQELEETPVYLRNEKVKINKKGMPTPLNKQGFGA